jgi:hypothetical protein
MELTKEVLPPCAAPCRARRDHTARSTFWLFVIAAVFSELVRFLEVLS